MQIEQLPNYGRGYVELSNDPVVSRRLQQAMQWPMLKVLLAELGPLGMLQTLQRTGRLTKDMLARDWSRFEQPGVNRRPLLAIILQSIALTKVLNDRVGRERALAIWRRLAEASAEKQLEATFASLATFQALPDCFAGFCAYFKGFHAATIREATHRITVKEDSPTALAFDITYCLWHEVAKEIGDVSLVYPACLGDDVLYPQAGARLGFRFTRSGTLVLGKPACDFRFEKL